MAGSLIFDPSPLVIVPLLFVLVVPFERLFKRHDQPIRRKHLGLDITYALSQPALGVVTAIVVGGAAIASLFWLPGLLLRPFVTTMSPVVQMLVGFVIFDFIIYWAHRFSHEVPFLWRFHKVHHSIETMDWVAAFRNHPVDGLILGPPVAFLLAAGFSLEVTGILAAIQAITGIFLHANVRWRLKPMQRLFITPEFHHWHHADELGAYDSNYSTGLPLWDMLFGTWFMPPNRRPQSYGLTERVPMTLAGQLNHPFRELRRPTWMLRQPIQGTKHVARSLRRGVGQILVSIRRQRRPLNTPPVPSQTSLARAKYAATGRRSSEWCATGRS